MKVEVRYTIDGRMFEVSNKFKKLEDEEFHESERYYDLADELADEICRKIGEIEGDICITGIYSEDGESLYEE